MRPRTALGAVLLLSVGGFLGSWSAASAASLQVDGGVLQTWSLPVDLTTGPGPTADETVTTEEAAPPLGEDAPTAEPAGDVATTTSPPPASQPEPLP